MAIVKVTYDAMYIEGRAASSYGPLFGAIWPERTGVFVVTIGEDGSGIQTNMTIDQIGGDARNIDAEHDPLFYVGEEGATYSFAPEAGTNVSVARCTVRESDLTYTGFTTEGVTTAEDGTVTITGLTSGRHIVKVEKDGLATYQVLTARKVSYKLTKDGEEVAQDTTFDPGDSVTVTYSDLTSPSEKFSGKYNFNFRVGVLGENGTQFSEASPGGFGVYNFTTKDHSLTVTIPADWTAKKYELSSGAIIKAGFAGGDGTHRTSTYGAGGSMAWGSEGTGYKTYGSMPAITLKVRGANTLPVFAEGVEGKAEATVKTGEAYSLDLGKIFTDADGDELTYKVSVNDGAFEDAKAEYSYTPAEAGTVTLAFKANDGTADSEDTYVVTLTVEKAPAPEVKTLTFKAGCSTYKVEAALLYDEPAVHVDEDRMPTYLVKIPAAADITVTEDPEAFMVAGSRGVTLENLDGETVGSGEGNTYHIDGKAMEGCEMKAGEVFEQKMGRSAAEFNIDPESTVWVFTVNGANSEELVKYSFEYYQLVVELDEKAEATGTEHAYGEPVWDWGEDYSSATVSLVCENDASHTLKEEAKVTSEKQKNGDVVYTASAELNGETVTDTKTVPREVSTIKVDFTSQMSGGFLHAPQFGAEVASNEAEAYGFTDEVDGVSALDVLVKAHELVYGEDFTKDSAADYLVIKNNNVDTQFGVSGKDHLGGFFVNHAFPNDGTEGSYGYNGTVVGTHEIKDGDLVEFFFYEDEYYGDTYDWFLDEDGKYSRSFTTHAGEELTLTLNGFFVMNASLAKDEMELVNLDSASEQADVQLYTVDLSTGALTAIDGAVTDEDGEVSFALDKAGTYTIAAYGTEDCTFTQIMSLTTVKVEDHKLTGTEAKAATCTEDGNIEYWTCDECGKIFADEKGEKEITKAETVIPAAGHKLSHTDAVAATCTEDGLIEYWTCDECGKYFSDAEGKTEIAEADLVVKAAGHKLTHVAAVDAKPTADGNIEHWICDECGKYFADEKGEKELTKAETVIKAIPQLKVNDTTFEGGTGTKMYTYEYHVEKEFVFNVEAPEDANIFINGVNGRTATFDASTSMVRVIIQRGTAGADMIFVTLKDTGHKLTHVEAVDAKPTADGNIEHWICDECGKYFSDAEGKTEITPESVVIPAFTEIKITKSRNLSAGTELTWTEVEGATGYEVSMKTDDGEWTVAEANAQGTVYVVPKSKLTGGTRYTYRVKALGVAEAYSNEKVQTWLVAPVISSLVNKSSGTELTWNAVDGAKSYVVMYGTEKGKWKTLASGITGTTYTVPKDKLTSGTKYYYTIKAKGAATSGYTSGKAKTWLEAPTVKSAKKVSAGVTVTWSKVKGAETYTVMYKEKGGEWKTAKSKVTGTSYTVPKSKLVSGKTYYFTVKAVGAATGGYTSGKSLTYKA